MGVKGWSKFVTNTMRIVRSSLTNPCLPKVNALYLDVSNIVLLDNNDPVSYSKKVIEAIDSIIQEILPTHYIYISFEGTSPFQKGFKKHNFSLEQRKYFSPRYKFDFPNQKGSPSAQEFKIEFYKAILSKLENSPAWKKPQIVVSTVNTPGEADYKIFDFARKIQKEIEDTGVMNPNDFVHAVVSADGDMSFIALASHLPSFYIIFPKVVSHKIGTGTGIFDSEIPDTTSKYYAVFTNILAEVVYFMMTGIKPDKETKEGTEKFWHVIDDFVLITMLVGNDFLIPLNFRWSDLKTYREFTGGYITTGNKAAPINNKNFAKFLSIDTRKRGAGHSDGSYDEGATREYYDMLVYTYLMYSTGVPNYTLKLHGTVDAQGNPAPLPGIDLRRFLLKSPGYSPSFAPMVVPPPTAQYVFRGYANEQLPLEVRDVLASMLVAGEIRHSSAEDPDAEGALRALVKATNQVDFNPVSAVSADSLFVRAAPGEKWAPVPIHIGRFVEGFEAAPHRPMPSLFGPSSPMLEYALEGSGLARVRHLAPRPLAEYAGLVGRIVLTGWPFLYPALVVQAYTEEEALVLVANEESGSPRWMDTTVRGREHQHLEIIKTPGGYFNAKGFLEDRKNHGLMLQRPEILFRVKPIELTSVALCTFDISLRSLVVSLDELFPLSFAPHQRPLFLKEEEVVPKVGEKAVAQVRNGTVVGEIKEIDGSVLTIDGVMLEKFDPLDDIEITDQVFEEDLIVEKWFNNDRGLFLNALSTIDCCEGVYVNDDKYRLSYEAVILLSLCLPEPVSEINGYSLWPKLSTTQIKNLSSRVRAAKDQSVVVKASNSLTVVPGRAPQSLTCPDVGERVVYISPSGFVEFGTVGVVVMNPLPIRRIFVLTDRPIEGLQDYMGLKNRLLICLRGDVIVVK